MNSSKLMPWTTRMLEVLADNQPHTLDELVKAAGPLIPPGRAARRHQARTDRNRQARGTTSPLHMRDPIESGRRSIIVDHLYTLRQHGRITYGAGVAQLASTS